MIAFIGHQEGDAAKTTKFNVFNKQADEFYSRFVEAMHLEGSYQLQEPCYSHSLINPDTPTKCQKGSGWVNMLQVIMGGDTSDKKVAVTSQDNFHRIGSIDPVMLPKLENSCPQTGAHPCVL